MAIDLIDSDLQDASTHKANRLIFSMKNDDSPTSDILGYRVATVISKSSRKNTIAGLSSSRLLSSIVNDEELLITHESG
jgi:hypothetical protein